MMDGTEGDAPPISHQALEQKPRDPVPSHARHTSRAHTQSSLKAISSSPLSKFYTPPPDGTRGACGAHARGTSTLDRITLES